MKKILQIIAGGDPGGGTTHTLQILKNLNLSYSLGLVTQKDSYLLKKSKSIRNIKCYGLDFMNPLNIFSLASLRRVCGVFNPDLVHIHGLRAGYFYYFSNVGLRYIYSVHGYHFLQNNIIAFNLKRCLERKIALCANYVILVSLADKRIATKYNLLPMGRNYSVVYYGMKIYTLKKASAISRNIAFIGRLVKQKDPLFFLDVVEKLPGYKVTVVGGGELEEKTRTESKRRGLNINFTGFLSHEEVLKVLPKFSAIVMTSRWEGLPIMAIESMLSGVPLVAINVGGLNEIIQNNHSGLLVESRSPADVASAIRRLDNDRKLRVKIILNAKKHIKMQFSEDKMIRKIYKIYNRCLYS